MTAAPSTGWCWFGTTDDMWEQIAACFGRRWVGWLDTRGRVDQGVHALLPSSAEEVAWTRVWLALAEEGRSQPRVGEVVAYFEREEQEIVTRRQPSLGVADRPVALAVVRGLRHALCAATDPMPIERAQEILTVFVKSGQSCDAASASSSHSVSR